MSPERPSESADQRADRNFNELLQEMRVLQAGVQILFAFLLTIPLQVRFERFDSWERGMLLAALVMSALAVTCFIAPVAYHRTLFRMGAKTEIVEASNRYARAGLAFLVLAICAALQLALDLIVGRQAAVGLAVGLAAVLVTVWGILPGLRRRHYEQARS
ncbi:MAG: DUF6328 family protein [Kineosporiaceae bacterium]